MNCPNDCKNTQPQVKCPNEIKCSDGSTRPCTNENNVCNCPSCPAPSGCREEKDPNGFIKVYCDMPVSMPSCPAVNPEAKEKCIKSGGKPDIKKDSTGCDVLMCIFNSPQATSTNVFSAYAQCPSSEEIDSITEKCKNQGLKIVMMEEGGCKIAKCIDESHATEWKKDCGMVPGPVREKIEKECAEKGMGTMKTFDKNGCPDIKCNDPDECQREISKQAAEKCKNNGGEFKTKTDDQGCIVFSDCIMRGDSTKVYVEKAEKVPEATDLLDIAMKLENLKITMDKLAKQTGEIADYYKSTGSNEEQRYRRVSGMFEAAKEKIDAIKTKIKDKMKSLTTDDITDIKSDIKYLKDVVIKDIVYVMLSTDEEVATITSGEGEEAVSENECKADSKCFDDALRICKPVKFISEGIVIKITGIEDKKCILNAFSSHEGQEYSMSCKLENYMNGIRDPETDIVPYCSGNLKDLVKIQKENEKNESCSGCFDNGVCDKGECSSCKDCEGDNE